MAEALRSTQGEARAAGGGGPEGPQAHGEGDGHPAGRAQGGPGEAEGAGGPGGHGGGAAQHPGRAGQDERDAREGPAGAGGGREHGADQLRGGRGRVPRRGAPPGDAPPGARRGLPGPRPRHGARERSVEKDPVKILTRLNELRALTKISQAGLLSSAEEAGVFSKLESAGAFSTAEKLLPILDDLKVLTVAESLLNVPANLIAAAGLIVLTGEAGLLTVVPDDNAALIAVQVLSGVLAGAGGVTLIASSVLLSLLQGDDKGGR